MKLITNIKYNEDRHDIEAFYKKYLNNNQQLTTMLPLHVLKKVQSKCTLFETAANYINLDWRVMSTRLFKVTSFQRQRLLLESGKHMHVNLLYTPNKDKLVLFAIGDGVKYSQLFIAYSGERDILYNELLACVGISELEAMANVIQFEEDEYDNV